MSVIETETVGTNLQVDAKCDQESEHSYVDNVDQVHWQHLILWIMVCV